MYTHSVTPANLAHTQQLCCKGTKHLCPADVALAPAIGVPSPLFKPSPLPTSFTVLQCCHRGQLQLALMQPTPQLSVKAATKNLAPLAPCPPNRYVSKLGGGGGLGWVAYKDRARPPP